MAYLTPDTPPANEYVCRRLKIPASPGFLELVSGALSELTKCYNWESFGTMSVEDTVQVFEAMFLDYAASSQSCLPGGGAMDVIVIRDEKPTGTNGGTFTAGAWQTRVLNTEVSDAGEHATLSSNQITLAAGTYRARIVSSAFRVDSNQVRLQNITDGTTELLGVNSYARNLDYGGSYAEASGEFKITSSKVFEVQHRCTTTQATNGFGVAVSWGTEIYTTVEFMRIGD